MDNKEKGVKIQKCVICGLEVNVYENLTVGAIGPAGGIIFYDCDADNGRILFKYNRDGLKSSECGWRFLEVSPVDIEKKCLFGDFGLMGTSSKIGAGKENSKKIVSYSATQKNNAAYECLNFEYADFDDWFLPSYKEMEELRNTYKSKYKIQSESESEKSKDISNSIKSAVAIFDIIAHGRFSGSTSFSYWTSSEATKDKKLNYDIAAVMYNDVNSSLTGERYRDCFGYVCPIRAF